jgi:hypothetical protein
MNKRQIAEEELKRALLMMKYDSRKTLTENVEEQYAVPAAAGAATGAAIGAATAGSVGGYSAVGSTAFAVGNALGVGATASVAILGGAVGLGVAPLAYWFIRKDTGPANSVKALFQMCSTTPNITKLERKLSDNQIRDLSDRIWDAVNYTIMGVPGTDEDSLYATFKEVGQGTAADVCALYSRYTNSREELYNSLDEDIDDPSEWEQIFRPLRNCVEDSLLALEKMNPCKEGEIYDEKEKKCVPVKVQPSPDGGKKTGGGGGKGSYKTCSGTYTQGCKSEIIKKVQGCLGLVADGKFGPKTQSSLVSKGYKSGFTDADVDKICNKVQTAPETPAKPNPYSNWSSEEPEGGTNINQPAEG